MFSPSKVFHYTVLLRHTFHCDVTTEVLYHVEYASLDLVLNVLMSLQRNVEGLPQQLKAVGVIDNHSLHLVTDS